jgi:hypothetical protein
VIEVHSSRGLPRKPGTRRRIRDAESDQLEANRAAQPTALLEVKDFVSVYLAALDVFERNTDGLP